VDAQYQRIATNMRRRITAAKWPPGARIPSWHELQRHYGVGQGAIRLAMEQLRAEGLIEGKPRARLTVAYRPSVRTLVDPDADWPHGRGDVVPGVCRPSPELCERLRVTTRARLHWTRSELLDPDGRPAILLTTWQRGARPHDYASVRWEARPHALTPGEAGTLGLAAGTSAFLMERTRYDADGR
jgi:DNA-binding GntR family transcriptional regulator